MEELLPLGRGWGFRDMVAGMGGASSGRGGAPANATHPNSGWWTPRAGELTEMMGPGVERVVVLDSLHHGDGGGGASAGHPREARDLRTRWADVNLGHQYLELHRRFTRARKKSTSFVSFYTNFLIKAHLH